MRHAILFLGMFVRRELGTAWAALLLALLSTDPVILNHARLDWGPQVIAAFMRVLSLIALWRWLQTGTKRWLLILCAALLLGFIDKLNFIWVIAAWTAAASSCADARVAAVARRPALAAADRGHHGGAARMGHGHAGAPRRAARHPRRCRHALARATAAQGVESLRRDFQRHVRHPMGLRRRHAGHQCVQHPPAVAAGCRGAAPRVWRPWSPARRFLAFLTAATAFLAIAIVATRQVGGSHHLVMMWPMPALHLVTLLAISTQHLGTERGKGMALRATLATSGAIVWGALLAWHIAMDIRYVDIWRTTATTVRSSTPRSPSSTAVSTSSGRARDLRRLGPAPAARDACRAEDTRAGIANGRGGSSMRRTFRATTCGVPSRRTSPASASPSCCTRRATRCSTGRASGSMRCSPTTSLAMSRGKFVNAAGKPLYTIVLADYKSCR